MYFYFRCNFFYVNNVFVSYFIDLSYDGQISCRDFNENKNYPNKLFG